MTQVASRGAARRKRHDRIRLHLEGTESRPRLAVFRSNIHIYAQVIDDVHKKTLTAVSDKALAKEGEKQPNKKARAKNVGTAIAKQCLEKGIDKVVFDRAGYKYHGRVSALADGAREAGLKF